MVTGTKPFEGNEKAAPKRRASMSEKLRRFSLGKEGSESSRHTAHAHVHGDSTGKPEISVQVGTLRRLYSFRMPTADDPQSDLSSTGRLDVLFSKYGSTDKFLDCKQFSSLPAPYLTAQGDDTITLHSTVSSRSTDSANTSEVPKNIVATHSNGSSPKFAQVKAQPEGQKQPTHSAHRRHSSALYMNYPEEAETESEGGLSSTSSEQASLGNQSPETIHKLRLTSTKSNPLIACGSKDMYHCPFPDCRASFHRFYQFKTHTTQEHGITGINVLLKTDIAEEYKNEREELLAKAV
eukprot:comp29165_c0_seq1/m.47222 comp29165_c0_seq1/g.47222  ORF comp29165_c0_seq1/g.47222 comp29165_c0_seq1/m.47222 type:complete len:294 (-) comp29165_c0_seq1:692-1573(-)